MDGDNHMVKTQDQGDSKTKARYPKRMCDIFALQLQLDAKLARMSL